MILPVFGERPAPSSGTAGPSWQRRFGLIAPALAVFGVALGLPAIRVQLWGSEPNSEPGYLIAFWTEATLFEFGERLARFATSTPSGGRIVFADSLSIFVGAAANHLFILACLATLLNRLCLAIAVAGLSASAAIGCLLPQQVITPDAGLALAPGYFVWCAAPVVLMIALWRGERATKRQDQQ